MRDRRARSIGWDRLSTESVGQGLEGLSAEEVVRVLGLNPHREGGYFLETYRAEQKVSTAYGKRAAATSVLYLLTHTGPSRFHRLRSDELWFYHSGALTELVLLRPVERTQPGKAEVSPFLPEQKIIGPGSPYALVPAGWWMAARVVVDGQAGRQGVVDWTLVSCVVTPGFEYEDFEMGEREALLRDFPAAREMVLALT